MTRMDRVALRILRPINPSVIIILGVYTIVWGLWLISPFWTVFTQAPLYSALMAIGSEYFWGSVATVSGMLISYGAIKPSYRNLILGSLVGFFYWFIIAGLYFAGDWMNTGGITSLAFAIYSALIWVNIKVNKSHFMEDIR